MDIVIDVAVIITLTCIGSAVVLRWRLWRASICMNKAEALLQARREMKREEQQEDADRLSTEALALFRRARAILNPGVKL